MNRVGVAICGRARFKISPGDQLRHHRQRSVDNGHALDQPRVQRQRRLVQFRPGGRQDRPKPAAPIARLRDQQTGQGVQRQRFRQQTETATRPAPEILEPPFTITSPSSANSSLSRQFETDGRPPRWPMTKAPRPSLLHSEVGNIRPRHPPVALGGPWASGPPMSGSRAR